MYCFLFLLLVSTTCMCMYHPSKSADSGPPSHEDDASRRFQDELDNYAQTHGPRQHSMSEARALVGRLAEINAWPTLAERENVLTAVHGRQYGLDDTMIVSWFRAKQNENTANALTKFRNKPKPSKSADSGPPSHEDDASRRFQDELDHYTQTHGPSQHSMSEARALVGRLAEINAWPTLAERENVLTAVHGRQYGLDDTMIVSWFRAKQNENTSNALAKFRNKPKNY